MLLPLAHASLAFAGEWRGKRTVVDGVEIVSNPAEPTSPPIVYDMKELWRLKSETEDGTLVFGLISDVEVDAEGNVYLLDALLMTIHVLSPDGKYLRSISQEGEGPGDLRSAEDLLIDSSGRAAVVEYAASRISYFTPDGLPSSPWEIQRVDSALVRPYRVQQVPGGLALEARSLRPRGDQATLRYFCGIFNWDGSLRTKLYERRLELDRVTGIKFREADAERVWCWSTDDRGWVFVAPEYSEYRILCFDETDLLRRTIRREHTLVPRTEEEVAEQLSIMEAEHGAYRNATCSAEKTHRAVLKLSIRKDSSLWVETTSGWVPDQNGVALIIDQFDSSGVFERQVILRGPMDSREDFVRIHGDLCFRITFSHGSYVSALSAGAGASETEDAVSVPEVICYRLEVQR